MSFKGVILYFRFKKMIYLQLLINQLGICCDRYYVIILSFNYFFLSICMVKLRHKAFDRNHY